MTQIKTRFHKDTFDKTTEDRRQRVIEVAIKEFAAKGYNAASINEIASLSGVSIGAMYSYFASKEDLFLAVVNRAFTLLERVLHEERQKHTALFPLLSALLTASREYALKYPDLNRIYLDLTTQALSAMAQRLASQLETVTVQFYMEVLAEAQKTGEIPMDADIKAAAFFIDNLFMMHQFSFSVDYYKNRMRIFLGGDTDTNDLEQKILRLLKSALLNP